MLRSKDLLDFDPANAKHVLAFRYIMVNGRLHPTMRFHLDEELTSDENGKKVPRYTSIISMCMMKIAKHHMDLVHELTGANIEEESVNTYTHSGVVRQLTAKQPATSLGKLLVSRANDYNKAKEASGKKVY